MDAAKILHELTYAEGLPREALKAASAQRVPSGVWLELKVA